MLPRGPVALDEEGRELDFTDNYVQRMLEWREAARQEAIRTARLNPDYQKIQDYVSALMGEHWDRRRPRYRSRYVDNRLMEARLQALSLLSDVRPIVEVVSRHSSKHYQQQAKVASMILRYEWYRQDMDLKLIDVVDHALFGVGYWKIGATLPGYMSVIPCGIDAVMPISPGQDLQESQAILYRAMKPLSYFLERWPGWREHLERVAKRYSHWETESMHVRPGHVAEYTWRSMSPGMKRWLSARQQQAEEGRRSPFPLLPLEEYWVDDPSVNEIEREILVKDPYLALDEHNYHYRVAPGERLFPRKRLIVFCDNLILYDGPSPYWHGMYPFVDLVLNPVPWAPYGLSRYRDLLSINQAINEIVAGILDAIKKAVNPQVIVREPAVRDADWNRFYPDIPGGKLKLTGIADPMRDLRYMEPPPIPGYVVQMLLAYLMPSFDRHSGAIDTAQLQRKRQVPGGETIEQLRDIQQPRFRLEGRRIDSFLRRAGTIAVSNIFQFYTAQQQMRILGPDEISWEDFDYNPELMKPDTVPREDHWKMFTVLVAPGSGHGTSEERSKQIALILYRLRAISRRELLRRMGYQNIEEIEQEIIAETAAGIGPPTPGRTPRQTRAERTAKM